MTKFKCAENSRDFVEVVCDKEGRPALTVGDNHSASVAFFAPSDAPALCLAILEAAGLDALSSQDIREALYHLRTEAARIKGQAKAEADRVALEQEALKLAQAGCEAVGDDSAETLDEMTVKDQKFFLAAARAARELNKEGGQ